MTVSLDREALSWAAGFFDGEGTMLLTNTNPKRFRRDGEPRHAVGMRIAVTQYDRPETILRFQHAVLGLGHVYGPYDRRWDWSCNRPDEILGIVPLLWTFLSDPKREQISRVLGAWLAGYPLRKRMRK